MHTQKTIDIPMPVQKGCQGVRECVGTLGAGVRSTVARYQTLPARFSKIANDIRNYYCLG